MALHAREARRITDDSIRNPVVGHFVECLEEEISEQAERGRSQIRPWEILSERNCPLPTHSEKEAIREHFLEQGFGFYEAPAISSSSQAYTVIQW